MKKTISFHTKFGWISAVEEKGKITEINFSKKKNSGKSLILNKLKKKIKDYFSGKTISLNIPLQITGNPIQKKVWHELKKIKFGQTKSYGDIAKKLKISPRHVGKVCGQNNHILLIPCHRVLRSDGSLGGVSALGGIKLKQKLLNFEKT